MNKTTERRDARCGTTCLLCYDGRVDHCAYCKVEEGVGLYGQELPPLPPVGYDRLGVQTNRRQLYIRGEGRLQF